jgi:hypothetical protein
MNLKYISMSMANCYFAEPHGMKHCYIPFFMLLISNALLVLARDRLRRNVTLLHSNRLTSDASIFGFL